ncbi:MAG TPA: methyltransferase domain-containing protein [Haliangiales bacterium]|nr:methyltransferase domain-containing protein [Haliangiales bacterium]
MTADPRTIKAQQKKIWDAIAPGWKKWAPAMDAGLAPVNELLLDMAKLQEGQWLLDVGTGHGEPAAAAARKVGPQGKVVGIDLSRRMLAIAEERAKAQRLSQCGFQELDAENLGTQPEGSYEAVLSRLGLSYLPQLTTAISGIRHVLTRGAPLAAAVWGPADRVPALNLPLTVLAEHMSLPPMGPGNAGPFGLSTPGMLEQAMSSGGFGAIRGERVTVVWEFPSAAAYVDYVKEATSLGQIVAEKPDERQAGAWAALAEAAAPLADAEGKLSFICDVICVLGKKK